MHIEVNVDEMTAIGYLLKSINNARLFDENKNPITGGEAIKLNRHLSHVVNVYNKMVTAKDGKVDPVKKKKQIKKKTKEEQPKETL